MTCIRRRSATSSLRSSLAMSTPSKRISPAVGRSSRRMHLPVVVLPQPLSPTSPKVSPRRTEKLIPSTAFTSPILRLMTIPSVTGKCICNPLTSRSGLVSIVATLMTLFVEPDRRQILIDVMAGADLPAFDIGPVRHGSLPPQQVDRMRLLVENVFVELEQIGALFGLVEFAQLLVVHLDFLRIVKLPVVRAGHRMRQVFADIGERIDDILAVALGTYIEIAATERLEPRPGRQHSLRDVQSDLAPLVNDPDAIVLIGLIDVAVQKLEAEPFSTRLLQEPSRLRPRLFDIGPIPGNLLQLLFCRGKRRVRERQAADRMNNGDLGQLRCAAPAVDGQCQRAPHADVVKRLALVVRGYHPATVPVTGLYGKFVAESLFQLVDSGGREAAKFDRRPIAADRLHPDGLLLRVDAGESVEIRQSFAKIAGVLDPPHRLADFVRSEFEGARPHDVLLVPVRVLV